MAETMHVIARTLHIGAAMLWVGYLGTLAWVLLPAARDGKRGRLELSGLVRRMRLGLWLGPLTFIFGAWLVTASGHTWGMLAESGWGPAVVGGIVVSIVMMGFEGGVLLPTVREADESIGGEREKLLGRAQLTATVNASLGLLATFLMVTATLGGI